MKLTHHTIPSSAFLAHLIFSTLTFTYAWGTEGHEIVATIAQVYLHPTALDGVCRLLNPNSTALPPCHLANVATWADDIKNQPRYKYSKLLHYINAVDDYPPSTCVFPGPRGWNSPFNVLSGIRNTTNILWDYVHGKDTRTRAEEALKFLIHFLGDMHQPLHLSGRDVGGNAVKVTFAGEPTSASLFKQFIPSLYPSYLLIDLHAVWDDFLIPQKMKEVSNNYSHPLPPPTKLDIESHLQGNPYDPYLRRLMYEGLGMGPVPGRFVTEGLEWLSCSGAPSPPPVESVQATLALRRVFMHGAWDDEVGCPLIWAKKLHPLNCKLPIWPSELDGDALSRGSATEYPVLELDTPQYSGRIREDWVVEKSLAQGGVRLAGILNSIFVPPEETTVLPRISL